MSIITRAMNADDDATILHSLRWLKGTHGGTGFMHESLNKDDQTNITRSRVAWAHALFGQSSVEIDNQRTGLTAQPSTPRDGSEALPHTATRIATPTTWAQT